MNQTRCSFVRIAIRFFTAACIGGVFSAPLLAQTIVWTDADARKIQRKEVSGGVVSTIVQFPSPQLAELIHYDPIGKKLYYLFDNGPNLVFQRSNPDGSEPEDIPTPHAGGFVLNIETRKLYWTQGLNVVLNYSDLDGTDFQSHTYPVCCLTPLLAFGDDVYLGGSLTRMKGIWRADADGSNEQLLQPNGQVPLGADYDPFENKVYVAANATIYRFNPDGTDYQLILQLESDVSDIIVDSLGRKLYWVHPPTGRVQRSDLDGSNLEDFVTPEEAGNMNLEIRGLSIIEAPAIPTISEWGILITVGAILLFGLGVLRKRAFN